MRASQIEEIEWKVRGTLRSIKGIVLTLAHKKVPEDLAQIGIIRLVIKTKRSAVLKVCAEFQGEASAE